MKFLKRLVLASTTNINWKNQFKKAKEISLALKNVNPLTMSDVVKSTRKFLTKILDSMVEFCNKSIKFYEEHEEFDTGNHIEKNKQNIKDFTELKNKVEAMDIRNLETAMFKVLRFIEDRNLHIK